MAEKDSTLEAGAVQLFRSMFVAIMNSKEKMGNASMHLVVPLGEIGDPLTEEAYAYLKSLDNEGIVRGLRVEKESYGRFYADGSYDESYAARADFTLSISKFRTLVQKYSLYPRFVIEFNPHLGVILNSEYILGRPQEGGTPYHFWQYILEHPNQDLARAAILEFITDRTKTESVYLKTHKLVEKYHFVRPVKQLFFPRLSEHVVHLRNPVFEQDIKESRVSQKGVMHWTKTIQKEARSLNPKQSQSFLNNLNAYLKTAR